LFGVVHEAIRYKYRIFGIREVKGIPAHMKHPYRSQYNLLSRH
jgi:hypothetical protein